MLEFNRGCTRISVVSGIDPWPANFGVEFCGLRIISSEIRIGGTTHHGAQILVILRRARYNPSLINRTFTTSRHCRYIAHYTRIIEPWTVWKCVSKRHSVKSLDIEDDELDSDSHSFQEGGDSVAAMRFITVAEGQKITLDNGTIYDFPVPKDMASNSEEFDLTTEIDLPNITQDLDEELVQACAKACRVEPQAIEDIFPATKAQVNLIAFHQKDGSFMPQNVFQIHGPARKDRIREVFEVIRQKNQILRTRIVKHNDAVYQVAVKGAAEWYEGTSLSQYKNQVYSKDGWVKYGDPLFRYAFIEEGRDLYFAYTSQHAGCDEWTNHMIFDAFEEGLHDLEALRQKPVRAQYKKFTEWFERRSAKKDDVARSMDYWKSYLEGFQSFAERFNVAPGHMANPTGRLTKIMPFKKQASAFSLATMAHAAWAISLGNVYQHDDILFWAVTLGRRPPRDELLPGIESIMGQVASEFHLRTRLRADQTIEDLVQGVQDHMIATIPHQRGVGHAREVLGPLYIYQTNFNWHSIGNDIPARVIDFENEDGSITRLEGRRDLQSPFKGPIPFVLDVWDHQDHLRVIAKWDQKLYHEDRVALMMDQLTKNLREIALAKAKCVGDLWKIQESMKNELFNGGLRMDETGKGDSMKNEKVNGGPTINKIVNGDSMDHESVNGDSMKDETVNGGPTLNDMINGDLMSHETINGDTTKERMVNGDSTNDETVNGGSTINDMVYGGTINHETINGDSTEIETANGDSANDEIIKGRATLNDLVNGDSIRHETING